MYQKYIKRLLDIIVVVIALIIFAPLYILIILLVRAKLGAPVYFVQPRPGKDGKIFYLKKFRTMTDSRDEHGELLPDSERLTRFGKFLRSTSLDELPEFFNVLRGDMSVVGPRPLLVSYLPLYTERQRKRHNVRPGITGYAVVKGRNTIDWEKKFELDEYYVDHVSVWLDTGVFFSTFAKVFTRKGVSHEGQATMEAFTGTQPVPAAVAAHTESTESDEQRVLSNVG